MIDHGVEEKSRDDFSLEVKRIMITTSDDFTGAFSLRLQVSWHGCCVSVVQAKSGSLRFSADRAVTCKKFHWRLELGTLNISTYISRLLPESNGSHLKSPTLGGLQVKRSVRVSESLSACFSACRLNHIDAPNSS